MNRFPSLAFRAAVAALILFSGASRLHAQDSTPPPAAQQPAPEAAKTPDARRKPVCAFARSAAAGWNDRLRRQRSALQAHSRPLRRWRSVHGHEAPAAR